MFNKTITLLHRSTSKYPLFYKRVLKTLDDDKKNKRDILVHCFYQLYCNIPIPINDLIKESKKNIERSKIGEKSPKKESDEEYREINIDSLFAPSVLQEFYASNKQKTTTFDFSKASKDKNFKEQLDLIKKGKFTKIEFLMNNKKFTPFMFKEPFNKEDYLKEFELISHFQKTLRESSPFIDAAEVKIEESLDNKENFSELKLEDVTPVKNEKLNKVTKKASLPVYAANRLSIVAKESLKRYLKKHNVNKFEIQKCHLMRTFDRSNNDFFRINGKDILLWKHSRDKKKLHFSLGKNK
ncbi:hypothetical protein QEN19_001182 [Hanseniaspora menglaensis]